MSPSSTTDGARKQVVLAGPTRRGDHSGFTGRSIVPVGCVAVVIVVVIVVKVRAGLHPDQAFHVTGLYDNLRADLLFPNVSNWNFRPVAYRVILAILSFGPMSLFGWTTQGVAVMVAFYYLMVFVLLYALAVPRGPSGHALFALGVVVLGSQDRWTTLSADEVAAIGVIAIILAILKYPEPRRSVQPLVVGLIVLVLFLVKGVSVLYVAPVLLALVHSWGLRRTLYAAALGVAGAVVALVVLFTRELIWIQEARVYHEGRPTGFGWVDIESLLEHDVYLLSTVIAVVVATAAVLLGNRWWIAAIGGSVVLAGVVVDALQGTAWAYHGVGLYAATALTLMMLASKPDPFGEARYSVALGAIVLASFPLGAAWWVVVDEPTVARTDPTLRRVVGVAANEEILYLGMMDRVATGYPYACGYFSAHPIQRVDAAATAQRADLPNSRAFLDCALRFDGRAVVMNLGWFDPAARGYLELVTKLCADFGVQPDQPELGESTLVLVAGGEVRAPFCGD